MILQKIHFHIETTLKNISFSSLISDRIENTFRFKAHGKAKQTQLFQIMKTTEIFEDDAISNIKRECKQKNNRKKLERTENRIKNN